MSKCHVEELQRVYAAVFQDLAYAYPALRTEFEKDQIRLVGALKQRGIHAACVDLPALGKHLDRCLSEGEYILSGLPLSKRMSTGVPIPKFLGGLYLLVFEPSGALKGDADVQAVACLRQVLYLAKAAKLECSYEQVCAEMREFARVDADLPDPEKFWSEVQATQEDVYQTYRGFAESEVYASRVALQPKDQQADLSTFLGVLDSVSSILATTLGPYSYGEWRFRHGPGAIAEKAGIVAKYRFYHWPSRLQREFPMDDCAFHSAMSWVSHLDKGGYVDSDPHSRLVAVAKTFTKPRLIAAEPGAHQFCQQNVWHYLKERVHNSWIGSFIWFTNQTRNQQMCLVGSRTGALATVDLSAASDRVSCHAVGQMFRRNPGLLLALQATRTRRVRQRSHQCGWTELTLKKFSTMGSACTFPVETLLFFCVVVSAVLTKRQMRPTLENIMSLSEEVTVFGDDLIVPVDSRELIVNALELLHFKLNPTKTFWTGRFRESCGVDAFRGVEVTPAKWKGVNDGTPAASEGTLATSNNFYSKFFVATSAYLDSTLRADFPLVPMRAGFDGRRSFVDPGPPTFLKSRWNPGLQRTEFLAPQHLAVVTRISPVDSTGLLQYFTEVRHSRIGYVGVSQMLSDSLLVDQELGYNLYPTLKLKRRWVAEQSFRQ